jgi:hypothetical protein
MPRSAKIYVASVIGIWVTIMALVLMHWQTDSLARFFVFLCLFVGAATLKYRVPGIVGTFSPVFFFALLGSATLSLSEVAVAGACGGIVQCIFRPQRRPSFIQVCFNAATLSLSCLAAHLVVQPQILGFTAQPLLISLALAASVMYFANIVLVSVVLTLVQHESLTEVWKHWCLGSLPFYLVGAMIVAATLTAQNPVSLSVAIMVTPAILLTTVYYRVWFRNDGSRSIQSNGAPRVR